MNFKKYLNRPMIKKLKKILNSKFFNYSLILLLSSLLFLDLFLGERTALLPFSLSSAGKMSQQDEKVKKEILDALNFVPDEKDKKKRTAELEVEGEKFKVVVTEGGKALTATGIEKGTVFKAEIQKTEAASCIDCEYKTLTTLKGTDDNFDQRIADLLHYIIDKNKEKEVEEEDLTSEEVEEEEVKKPTKKRVAKKLDPKKMNQSEECRNFKSIAKNLECEMYFIDDLINRDFVSHISEKYSDFSPREKDQLIKDRMARYVLPSLGRILQKDNLSDSHLQILKKSIAVLEDVDTPSAKDAHFYMDGVLDVKQRHLELLNKVSQAQNDYEILRAETQIQNLRNQVGVKMGNYNLQTGSRSHEIYQEMQGIYNNHIFLDSDGVPYYNKQKKFKSPSSDRPKNNSLQKINNNRLRTQKPRTNRAVRKNMRGKISF